MKKTLVIVLTILCSLTFTSCGFSKETYDVSLSAAQIESVCQLATLNCHFNNVAKGRQEKSTGIQHIGEKELVFWIEYTGTLKVGVDLKKLNINIYGNTVEIYLPEAQIIPNSTKIKEQEIKETIVSKDSWNKNKITADNQKKAINEAQKEMENSIKNDYALLENARNSAKLLIENYINSIGDLTGKKYKIIWLGDENTPIETSPAKAPETTTETTVSPEN